MFSFLILYLTITLFNYSLLTNTHASISIDFFYIDEDIMIAELLTEHNNNQNVTKTYSKSSRSKYGAFSEDRMLKAILTIQKMSPV